MATSDSTVLRADGEHPTPPAPAPEPAGVTVDVSQLILGREIRFPIHDKNGVLLLREGSVITSAFKRKLESRHVAAVCVHQDDAGTIAFRGASMQPGAAGEAGRPAQFDTAISQKLDAALAEGLPFVTNQGPAVRRSLVYHGDKAYDPVRRAELEEEQRRSGESLSDLMREAVRGGELNGAWVADTASKSLSELTADMDQVLSLSVEVQGDQQLAAHCVQMSTLGMALAIELGLNSENVCRVGVTGLVHDWGMLRVPAEIREAPRRLTAIEQLEIRKHPVYSLDLLEGSASLPSLVPMIAYQVHEKIDGTGYPRGRVERNIHLFARILHVADVYAALTSPRPWRPAYSPYAAMCSLLSGDNVHGCDPLVIRALLRVKSLFPAGSYVTLTDSSVAQVLRANGDKYTEPIVQLVQDARGRSLHGTSEAVILDLSRSPLGVAEALPTPGRKEETKPPHFVRKRTGWLSPAHSGVTPPHVAVTAPKAGDRTTTDGDKQGGSVPTPRPHIRLSRKPNSVKSAILRQE